MWLRRHYGLEKVSLHSKCQKGGMPKRCADLLQCFANNGIQFNVRPTLDGPKEIAPAHRAADTSAVGSDEESSRERQERQALDAVFADEDMMMEALGIGLDEQVAARAANRAKEARERADAAARAVQQRHMQRRRQQVRDRNGSMGLVLPEAYVESDCDTDAIPSNAGRRWRSARNATKGETPVNHAGPLYRPAAHWLPTTVPPLAKNGVLPRHRRFMPEALPRAPLPRHATHMRYPTTVVLPPPPPQPQQQPSACDSVPTGQYEFRLAAPRASIVSASSLQSFDDAVGMELAALAHEAEEEAASVSTRGRMSVSEDDAMADLLVCRPEPASEMPAAWSMSTGAQLTPAATLPAIQDGAYAALAVTKPAAVSPTVGVDSVSYAFGKDIQLTLSDDEFEDFKLLGAADASDDLDLDLDIDMSNQFEGLNGLNGMPVA